MADSGFENKQKWKEVYKSSPLLAILLEGPQKKFLQNLIMNYVVNLFLFLHRQEWLECSSKIKCNKN
jgi:hypothetical protein